MSAQKLSLPVVRPLPDSFSLLEAFERLSERPGCLWLDSTSRGPLDSQSLGAIGRYSFLTADPVQTLTASPGDPDPWPQLARWCDTLPDQFDPTLPPFQGGVAGLIGYEAAGWLEPVGSAAQNDLPTPALSIGLYDWTIAVDHGTNQAWLISQGLGESDEVSRVERAHRRADQIESLLLGSADQGRSAKSGEPPRAVHPQGHDDATEISSNFTGEEFRASVAEIVRRIRDGDSFQVNLAQRLLKRADRPAADLYRNLRAANPAPFSAFYRGDSFTVLSSSPEGFLKVRNRQVETRPIKGTTARTGDDREDMRLAEQLFASEKDRAENIMIVDLMRNDLSRVCDDDSIKVSQLCEVESYQFVQHLVSVVRGRLRHDRSVVDLLRACFPGGSVTGAPKIEAMRTIASLEPHHRGPYCGSIGYISCGGDADFNILIRTITESHGYWQIPVGGGITARSEPAAEEAETWAKAKGMLKAFEAKT